MWIESADGNSILNLERFNHLKVHNRSLKGYAIYAGQFTHWVEEDVALCYLDTHSEAITRLKDLRQWLNGGNDY